MKTKVPEVWDNCKTPEQKKAFIDMIDKIDKTSKTTSFDDFIFDEYMGELSK